MVAIVDNLEREVTEHGIRLVTLEKKVDKTEGAIENIHLLALSIKEITIGQEQLIQLVVFH